MNLNNKAKIIFYYIIKIIKGLIVMIWSIYRDIAGHLVYVFALLGLITIIGQVAALEYYYFVSLLYYYIGNLCYNSIKLMKRHVDPHKYDNIDITRVDPEAPLFIDEIGL